MPLWNEHDESYKEIHEIIVPHLGHIPIGKGDFHRLPRDVRHFIGHWVDILNPRTIYICDGSDDEAHEIISKLEERGTLHKLRKYENNYICRTDPKDVARVESKTYISTEDQYMSVPHVKEGTKGILGQWESPEVLNKDLEERMPGCMTGRTMYVIPFSMGPVGSPLSKIGIELTDSSYVVLSMRIMTRVTSEIWNVIRDHHEFVKCVHSVGCPRPVKWKVINHWPCNPEKTLIAHLPDKRMVISYGSGYGGNSLLGKKCFALRIAGRIAYDEGWMAEHMLIMSVTNPQGVEKFIAAAFPSACGKTNMAMLEPSLPGWKVQVVGDDIAWMRFDKNGVLRGINPERGFFGVAPGTNYKTNPNAMKTLLRNSIMTNIAEGDDGSFFWEGMEKEVDPDLMLTSWLGERFTVKEKGDRKAAHPNSRFCCPAEQCPIIHPKWEDPEGVPISALIFGGRRPEGIPVVMESFDWKHGVMLGASLKSEATAAAEFKGKVIMHDPMAMRPFMGYNFGKYLQHWLDFEDKPDLKLPKIFHVKWFRLDEQGKFVWPGFGENIRAIDWMLRRCDGEDIAEPSPIGLLPKKGSLNLDGINTDWNKMFNLPKDYLLGDIEETRKFLQEQTGTDLPKEILNQLSKQEERIKTMSTK